MRYLIIENGVVTNSVVAEADFAANQGWIAAPVGVGIGWAFNGEDFTPPLEPDPPTMEEVRAAMPQLSPVQFRLLLDSLGFDDGDVEVAIGTIADPDEQRRARIHWEYATYFERSNPLVDMIGAALGMTPEQIDAEWLAFAELNGAAA